ncbi:MAG: biopolymer transporter ExbD [Candidatus Methylacidiphilales bacterium]|nr:biopolymer transporter ExbD [Candidatus Methylacidiphilales bacterium]
MRSRRAVVDEPGDAPEFQVSAMVDILMTMLVFFVATATFEYARQPADLALPRARREGPGDSRVAGLVLQLEREGGRILADQVPVARARDLVPLIRERMRTANRLRGQGAEFRVLIRADRTTPYWRVEEIMRAAGEAGVVDVLFAMERPGKKEKGGGS